MIGLFLAWLAAAAFAGIGLGALAAPGFSSVQYGLPVSGAAGLGLVRALGARDLVLGGIIAALAAGGPSTALAASLGVAALAGAADFAIVWSAADPKPARSLATHGAGTIALLAAAAAVAAAR